MDLAQDRALLNFGISRVETSGSAISRRVNIGFRLRKVF
jgi:hypothetical protein